MSGMSSRAQDAALCMALCVAIGITYAPALDFSFVSFDDDVLVYENSAVNQGLSADTFWWAFADAHRSNWMPLTWLSHAADVSLFDLDAGAHHGVNLLLHALNACLLFLLLRRMSEDRDRWKCGVVAALFALHPAHVETVAWVSERKGLLSTAFGWLAIVAYLHHVRAPSPWRFTAVALAMATGLLAKSMLVTLPFVLLLIDWWPLRRLRLEAGAQTNVRPVLEKLPLLALSLAASAVTVWAQTRGGALQSLEAFPLDARLSNALVATARYLGILVWPVDLSPFYPVLEDGPSWLGAAGAAAALLLALSALALWQARERPYLLFGWLWFLGTLVPVIGLVQVGDQAIAHRYTYVPYVGLFVAVVWGLSEWGSARRSLAPRVIPVVLVLVACAFLGRAQLSHWRDSRALWQRAVDVTPSSAAHAQLSRALRQEGDFDEALEHAKRAVELDPEDPDAHTNLAGALLRMDRRALALTELGRAAELAPQNAGIQLIRAIVLRDMGRFGQATKSFARASTLDPEAARSPVAHSAYAESLLRELGSGQASFVEVLEDHRQALALHPSWSEVLQNLIWLLATHPEATPEHGREAARLAAGLPEDSPGVVAIQSLDTLAAATAAAGEFERAVAIAEQALGRAENADLRLVAESIRARLALYREGKRYTEPPRRR